MTLTVFCPISREADGVFCASSHFCSRKDRQDRKENPGDLGELREKKLLIPPSAQTFDRDVKQLSCCAA